MKHLLNIQLFAEEEKPEVEENKTEENKTEENKTDGGKSKTNDENDDQQKSYIKIREEKAQKQLLKQLGVTSVDEAISKINKSEEALQKITELEQKIAKAEQEKITDSKIKQLTAVLENEKVFDSDALIHYLDLDSIELDSSGKIKESDKIVSQLKSIKPHYFGKEFIKSDSHIQSNSTTTHNEYEEAYKKGDYVGAIATYLKNTKK